MSTETQRAEFDAWWEEIENFSRRCERLQAQFEGDQFGFAFAVWQAAQSSQAAEIEALRDLLNEVRACFTRDDDLPDDLLPRIDAAMQTKEAS